MARAKQLPKIFTADFETTVYKGQKDTLVWAYALCEIETENCIVGNSIENMFQVLQKEIKGRIKLYFHNLKFDGSFIVSYLLKEGYSQAFLKDENGKILGFLKSKDMENHSFKYSISAMGLWYSITIKINKFCFIEIYDSLKLLPFSVEVMAKQFGLAMAKGEIEYEKFRYPGMILSQDEIEYIKKDVQIVAQVLKFMFGQGHNRMTIGSCCMFEFKKTLRNENRTYSRVFPNLYKIEINAERYGSKTIGDYIKKSYHGGWTYVVPEKRGKILYHGLTADVNSLYPSMMESESGNSYPMFTPHFGEGFPDKEIVKQAHKGNAYYFIRFKCKFRIKKGKLPFVQIRNSFLYNANKHLTTSNWIDIEGNEHSTITLKDGTIQEVKPELTMTWVDFDLFQEHYDIIEPEWLDYCYFYAEPGIFDTYIHKYKDLKIHAENKAIRTLAKLFSNNLYGKLAATDDSSFKVISLDEKGAIVYHTIEEHGKTPGFIACGSAITSYARNFTIRCAQNNFHGGDQSGFAYADTDSIHCDGMEESDLIKIPIDPVKYSHFKIETKWSEAIFARQKTYIEHLTEDDGKPSDSYLIKCAGLGKKSKKLIEGALLGKTSKDAPGIKEEYKQWLDEHSGMELTEFCSGFTVPGTLRPKRINGGTVLIDDEFHMKEETSGVKLRDYILSRVNRKEEPKNINEEMSDD